MNRSYASAPTVKLTGGIYALRLPRSPRGKEAGLEARAAAAAGKTIFKVKASEASSGSCVSDGPGWDRTNDLGIKGRSDVMKPDAVRYV
jgi:hypothetical protein